MDYEEAKARYVELVATIHEAQLRGAKMPYTSMNGNMYSYLGENGVALRLPADVREEFIAKYRTTLSPMAWRSTMPWPWPARS